MSILNEDLMKTNLDIPDGEIKIDGKVNPVYADAINVHNKKKKDIEKILKDKQPELKKPFLGTKGTTTIMPKTKDLKKLKLAEDMFKSVRESMADAPEAYEGIFRVVDNMEHIINYISELSEEELTYEDMKQSYDVLDDAMTEFSGYLEELKSANGTKSIKEAMNWTKGEEEYEIDSTLASAPIGSIIFIKNSYGGKNRTLKYEKISTDKWDNLNKFNHRTGSPESDKSLKDKYIDGATWKLEKSVDESISMSRNGSLKEATAVKSRKETKDIWDDIYAELVGVKSVEASRRRLDRTPSERYPADWRENGPRVGMSRYEDALVVKADTLEDLDFGKEVAETYGVEWRVKEHTSMYADSKYELLIYPFKPVLSESLVESVDNEVYSAVAKYYDYGAPSDFIEVIADLVDRALLNKREGHDVDEAVMDAIDSGLIYHKDIWTIKSGYEDSILSDEAYEQLRNDLYSIVDSFEDEEIEEGLTSAQRYNRKMDKIFQDKKDRDADMINFIKANSDVSDEEIKKAQDDDKVGLLLKNKGLHDKYWAKNESLNESYIKVDIIECGEDTYRVVSGGFNPSAEALVTVEDEHGERTRIHIGDVIEFYTWYDKNGNVIHEPSEDSLDEAVCNYVDTYNGATIYECEGKYSANVHGKSISGKSIEDIKAKIDKSDKEYRDHFNHIDD